VYGNFDNVIVRRLQRREKSKNLQKKVDQKGSGVTFEKKKKKKKGSVLEIRRNQNGSPTRRGHSGSMPPLLGQVESSQCCV